MEKRIYRYLIILTTLIIIVTSIILSLIFFEIHTKNLEVEISVSSLILMILPATIGILVIVLAFLYIISSKLTSKVLEPIHMAADNIESILSGEEIRFEKSYEELTPFLSTIKFQKVEIENSIKKLKETEKYRREFAANVSHELKTPLTSINGYAELISNGITKEEDNIKFANIILKEGNRLLELIDDLINLSKLDNMTSLRIRETMEDIDIFKMAKIIVSSFEDRASLNNININLSGEAAVIKANRKMIEELISNLIENGIKYNKQNGSIDISILKDEKHSTIRIKDTGMGIPETDKERVFERFYRVDKSRSKRINGTGIGLSIVKHIVEYHNGKITLESKVDKGTEIEVVLPNN